MTDEILFVDDEQNILESYKRSVRRQFTIETALGAEAGLEAIQQNGTFAVIVSDMRMPGMNGTQFLSKVRHRCPDTVRMLLTGQADVNDAIAVVNEGQIFRFLTKPCPPEILAKALNDGIEQYRLITAEKELLEKTLKGSIKLLIDILSIVRPEAFGRSVRIRKSANEIASHLDLKKTWQLDLAASLSQIGCVTIPGEILSKKYQGQSLSESEKKMFSKHLQIGRDLLKHIPRLEDIAEAIAYQEKRFDGGGLPKDSKKEKDIPIIARILKVVHDFDELVMAGKSNVQALEEMHLRGFWYDPEVLAALKASTPNEDNWFVVREIGAINIRSGMVLAEDLKTKTNQLLVSKRHEITDSMQMCIWNFAENNNIVEPIKIIDSLVETDHS